MKIDLTNIQTRYFHFDCPFCHIVTRHFTERFDSASAKAMTLLLQNPLIHLLRVIDEHENIKVLSEKFQTLKEEIYLEENLF